MEPKTSKSPESLVREIKRRTRRKFNAEEKIRIILEGLKGEDSIAAICRHLLCLDVRSQMKTLWCFALIDFSKAGLYHLKVNILAL